jgi:hypothetical protein
MSVQAFNRLDEDNTHKQRRLFENFSTNESRNSDVNGVGSKVEALLVYFVAIRLAAR